MNKHYESQFELFFLFLHLIFICEITFMNMSNVNEFSKMFENKHIITEFNKSNV